MWVVTMAERQNGKKRRPTKQMMEVDAAALDPLVAVDLHQRSDYHLHDWKLAKEVDHH